MIRLFLGTAIVLIGLYETNTFAQALKKSELKPAQISASIKSSPAYAELLLRQTDIESDLESLLVSYTEEFPKVKENRYELNLIKRDMNKLLAVPQADAGKLTLALGKLLVRRAEVETDLWAKQNQYGDEHPEVKRAKKKVEVFNRAIKEILP